MRCHFAKEQRRRDHRCHSPVNSPRDHHVVPQFYLRNFAVDEERKRVTTLAKSESLAIWKERPIKSIGHERDFYVHTAGGRPVSVETAINRSVETPISRSDTWAKITAGHSDQLDASDRPILYSLVRHLEARTPHYHRLGQELAAMAAAPSAIPFTHEEREMYAALRASPALAKAIFNLMAQPSFANQYDRSLIQVVHSPIPLRTSTTPVIAMPAPAHPAMGRPLPGLFPFQRVLVVDPHTLVSVVVGDFGGTFAHSKLAVDEARGFNRSVCHQLTQFDMVRHMLCGCEGLRGDMNWAGYELEIDTPAKLRFRRNPDTTISEDEDRGHS